MDNTLAICQPHFIPWIGYFYLIKKSSKIIFLDNVQYNRRSWQNRAHIKASHNLDDKKLLSLHVKDNSRKKMINEIFIKNENEDLFLNNIKNSYSKSPHFEKYYKIFKDIFEKNKKKNLANFNILFIKEICKFLKIDFSYDLTSNYFFKNKKENLILEILKHFKADIYLSNEGSKKYVDDEFFIQNNIKIIYNTFEHPIYRQNNNNQKTFIKNLSIIDLLMNEENPQKYFKI
jgi:hypothetical protein